MFAPDIAARVPVGATIDLVNQYRLPVRPLEQLPTARDRYALGVRLAKRFSSLNATLRLDQRLYYDTWGIAGDDDRRALRAGRRQAVPRLAARPPQRADGRELLPARVRR